MKNNIKKRAEGFTIIEVLIVLAIAGLIIVIVLLAVPALNRNSANTTKRSDATKTLGAVGEFAANNNGGIPVAGDVVSLTTLAKLSSGTTISSTIPSAKTITVLPTNNEIMIATGVACVVNPTNTTGVMFGEFCKRTSL